MIKNIWFILFSLDKVLSANVLSTRLDPESTEAKVSPTIPFLEIKTKLVRTSRKLEPFIVYDVDDDKSEGEQQRKVSDWFNKIYKKYQKPSIVLDRVIDSYLIDFEKVRLELRDDNKDESTNAHTTLKHTPVQQD